MLPSEERSNRIKMRNIEVGDQRTDGNSISSESIPNFYSGTASVPAIKRQPRRAALLPASICYLTFELGD
jgi:hypothetical protein